MSLDLTSLKAKAAALYASLSSRSYGFWAVVGAFVVGLVLGHVI